MSSNWRAEVGAILRKELRSEMRSRSSLGTLALFSIVTVITVSIAAGDREISGTLAAGLLWACLLFAGTIGLSRTFIAEEEGGTGDLLRLLASPYAVFWGKAIYNVLLMLTVSTGMAAVFLLTVQIDSPGPISPALFFVQLVGACAALAGAVTLCGALVAKATNRAALAAAISLPLMLPLAFLGISGMRIALGEGLPENGPRAALGLLGYATLSLLAGPYLFAAVWKE